MSYVSIWTPVNDRIVQASRGNRDETIGLLLGRLEDDTLVIEDSVTGEYSAESTKATLPATALAKIADALVTGRIKGNIVGWYHSHTEGGLFFSETDIETQKNLQQFSSLITGMVVDASNGEVGFFRVDPQTGTTIRIPADKIRLFAEPGEAVPPEARTKQLVATPTVEVRRTARPRPAKKLAISIVLIVLVASLAWVGVFFYGGFHAPTLTITHTPPSTAIVGTPIEITANVTGEVQNVTLTYAAAGSGYSTEAPMSSTAPGRYTYLIPGKQVTANMLYHITAVDTAGNKATTNAYTIAVADFSIVPTTTSLAVYRNSTEKFALGLTVLSVNGFAEALSLSASGTPQGVDAVFSPNPAPPGTRTVQMTVSAAPNAPYGTAAMTISAIYAPAESAPVYRQATLSIVVTDFDLQVNPASNQVAVGSTATFTLSITLQKGFVDPVTVKVLGIPQGAKYQLTTNNATVLGGGPGTTTATLQIPTSTLTKRATYLITIVAEGDGVMHSRTVQLIVR